MHCTDWRGFGETDSCNRLRSSFRQRSEAMSQTKVSQPEHRNPLSHMTVRRRPAVCAVDNNSQLLFSIRKVIRVFLQVRNEELHKLKNTFQPNTIVHRYTAQARASVLSLWESKVLEGSSLGSKKWGSCEFWRAAPHGSRDVPYIASASEGILDKLGILSFWTFRTSLYFIHNICSVWYMSVLGSYYSSVPTYPAIRILSVYNLIPSQSFGIQHRPSTSAPPPPSSAPFLL